MKRKSAFRLLWFFVVLFLLFQAVPPVGVNAWDSIVSMGGEGENSHYLWVEDAIDELRAESPIYNDLDRLALQQGAEDESMHPNRRNILLDPGTPPAEYIELAVGNNGGSTTPEYYWQAAVHHYRKYIQEGRVDPKEKEYAYRHLGTLLHIIEDSSSPPHVYNVLHGSAYIPLRQDTIEYLSALVAFAVATGDALFGGNYPYSYYMRPDSLTQPGKNVLDVMSHYDESYVVRTLRQNTQDWSELFTTNLQAPAARKVKIYTQYAGIDPTANPVFYLRFEYFNRAGEWVVQETGAMCASIDPLFNAPCTGTPRKFEWSDSFAANTPLMVYYRRPEGGYFAVDRDVSFKVYVEETENVVAGMVDPGLNNPWEYSDWLQKWTIGYATAAPFWRRYWTNAGDYGDLYFNVEWLSAPNSERALLTMLAHGTKEVVKWTLRSAYRQFQALEQNATAVPDEATLGDYSYRVAFYADLDYNSNTWEGTGSGSPEYLRSISFTCTPYEYRPCQPLFIDFNTTYPWMKQIISSMAVRNAEVTLYHTSGVQMLQNMDTPNLGSFNDQVVAVRITPKYQVQPPDFIPAMTAGNSHTCRLGYNGHITCWGNNSAGEASPPNEPLMQVSAGATHTCALRDTGSAVCWGSNYFGESTPPSELFRTISAGTNFSCGIKADGTGTCWGDNRWGQATVPQGIFYDQISAGTNHACGIRSSIPHTVICWGNDPYPLVTPAGEFKAISVGDNYACGIRRDGSSNGFINCWGMVGIPDSGPIFEEPAGLFSIQIDAGISHACAIRSNGTVACWGQNSEKQLEAPGGYFNQVGVGHYHSCALRDDNFMQCWGNNTSGQAPVLIMGPASLSSSIQNHAYSTELTTMGGKPPYSYSLWIGVLPSGLILDPYGSLTGTPTSIGSYTFTVRSIDMNFFVNFKTYLLNVIPNRAPTAIDDFATCIPGTSVMIDVVANDFDPDWDRPSLVELEQPLHGTVEIAKGRARYLPNKGYLGPDSFDYWITDSFGGSDFGTVTLVVDYLHTFIPLVKR